MEKENNKDAEFRGRIQQLLLCSICFECLTEPKTLQCQHTFCFHCLEKYILKREEEEKKKYGITFRCPTCRKIQDHVKTKADLLLLDASLYIKQALAVIKDYEKNPEEEIEPHKSDKSTNVTPSIDNLSENCYILDDNENPLKNNENSLKNNETPLENNSNLLDNNCKYPNVEKTAHLVGDFNDLDCESDRSKDCDLKNIAEACDPEDGEASEDDDGLLLTQEFTIGKICKKIFRGKGSKKYREPVKTHYDRSSYLDSAREESQKRSSEKYVPKYIGHTTPVTGFGLRPRYVPGSLNKTRPITTVAGYGMYLKQHPKKQSSTVATHESSYTKEQSSMVQGPFGNARALPFMPNHHRHNNHHQAKKVVFAVKF